MAVTSDPRHPSSTAALDGAGGRRAGRVTPPRRGGTATPTTTGTGSSTRSSAPAGHCVGVIDDVAARRLDSAHAGDVPVVVTRSTDGELKAFLNACRHRTPPWSAGCGTGRVLRCPYHAWIYRLDGSLATSQRHGGRRRLRPADFGLLEVGVAQWARFVFVCPVAEPADVRPRSARLRPRPLRHRTSSSSPSARPPSAGSTGSCCSRTTRRTSTPRGCTRSSPGSSGSTPSWPTVRWCWPGTGRSTQTVPSRRLWPTPPRWTRAGGVAATQIDEVFLAGAYFTVFPNLLVSMFPRYLSAFWLTPVAVDRTAVSYVRMWHPEVDDARRAADLAASEEVAAQDLDICEALQRTASAGIDHAAGCRPSTRTASSMCTSSCVGRGPALGRLQRWPANRWKRARRRSSRRPARCSSSVASRRCASRTWREQLGVSTGLIHYHFESKEQLLEAAPPPGGADRPRPASSRRRRGPGPGRQAGRVLPGVLPEGRRARLAAVDRRLGELVAPSRARRISQEFDEASVQVVEDVDRARRRRGHLHVARQARRRGASRRWSTASPCRCASTTAWSTGSPCSSGRGRRQPPSLGFDVKLFTRRRASRGLDAARQLVS